MQPEPGLISGSANAPTGPRNDLSYQSVGDRHRTPIIELPFVTFRAVVFTRLACKQRSLAINCTRPVSRAVFSNETRRGTRGREKLREPCVRDRKNGRESLIENSRVFVVPEQKREVSGNSVGRSIDACNRFGDAASGD